jgi:hypothetical protein
LRHNASAQLSSKEKMFCDKSLTVDELGAALKLLSNGKAPGIDGLPTEFFKMFWDDLKDVFLNVLNESYHKGMLPDSMRMSIIALIYKKKSRQDIRKYRPISLLCTDYKIVAKALAKRMRQVLPNIIHKDQTGFFKDRYIGENITLFLDIQEYMAKELQLGLCFLADWEKAYDLVDRPILKNCLLQFGIGDSFLGVATPGFKTWYLRIKTRGLDVLET